MLNLYWLCFAVGGVFVLLAVLSGLDGVDFGDHDFDTHDSDLELVDVSDRPAASIHKQYWIFGIVKSLKFWTFGICFFGLTGLVLSHLSLALTPPVIAIVSLLMGLICGTLIAGSLHALRRRKSDSLVRSNDLVGSTGIVQLPFSKENRGKVRLSTKGSLIDLIACTDEPKDFKVGDRVLIVSTEQSRVWVVSADGLSEE